MRSYASALVRLVRLAGAILNSREFEGIGVQVRCHLCCPFGRAPSQSLGVALSAVLLGRITGLRGAAAIAHAECGLVHERFVESNY